MKGITPVVATIMLLIIAVAIVGLAYGFITGFFGGVTGKAAIVSGRSSCVSSAASIIIRNVGTGEITDADISVIRTSGGPTGTTPSFIEPASIQPQQSGTVTERTDNNFYCGYAATGPRTCTYDVFVGGVRYPTRVDC